MSHSLAEYTGNASSCLYQKFNVNVVFFFYVCVCVCVYFVLF